MTGLVRSLGRYDLTALSLNTIVGSGIFLLPATAAAATGIHAPLAFVVSGLLSLLFAATFAEANARVPGTGGPYAVARAALGDFAGFEVGWLFWLSRMAAVAASYNVFLAYLAEFVPGADTGAARVAVITAMAVVVTALNVRGVRTGATVTNVFTVAKLLPLITLVAAAAWYLAANGGTPVDAGPADGFWRAVLLVAFAFGGFEVATVPGGESRSPARDVPAALFMSIGVAILLYVLLQALAYAVLPALGTSARPLADAAAVVFGAGGATLVAAGALVSTAGYVFGASLVVPRIAWAMADAGQFPSPLARIHPIFHTPWIAIVAHGALTWLLAAALGFFSLVVVNVLARLVVIAATCVAVLVLRRRQGPGGEWTAPGGALVPLAGLAAVAALLTQAKGEEIVWGLAALAAGSAIYKVYGKR
ncbi:MAG: amino acid permease [Gammaproteobacteria bacterium]|nr:amino acid permease [Gammaproteobacteria bacterium]